MSTAQGERVRSERERERERCLVIKETAERCGADSTMWVKTCPIQEASTSRQNNRTPPEFMDIFIVELSIKSIWETGPKTRILPAVYILVLLHTWACWIVVRLWSISSTRRPLCFHTGDSIYIYVTIKFSVCSAECPLYCTLIRILLQNVGPLFCLLI